MRNVFALLILLFGMVLSGLIDGTQTNRNEGKKKEKKSSSSNDETDKTDFPCYGKRYPIKLYKVYNKTAIFM